MPTYKGPYSSDDGFENFTKGLSRDASYPGRKPNVYDLGPPCKSIDANGVPFGAINLSATIDPQVGYNHAFDADKNANWSRDKSADSIGGFSGDLLPKGRAGNHPKRGSGV
jgi:hypothetical protein